MSAEQIFDAATEREVCRRAQRFWRIFSVIAGVGAGFFWWPLGLLTFGFFQFIAVATRWHSERLLERQSSVGGLTPADEMRAIRPK